MNCGRAGKAYKATKLSCCATPLKNTEWSTQAFFNKAAFNHNSFPISFVSSKTARAASQILSFGRWIVMPESAATMDLQASLEAAEALLRTQPPARLAAVVTIAAVLLLFAARFLRFARRWTAVYLGTQGVPCAPGAVSILGHIPQLASGCSWGKMYDWLGDMPNMVRIHILHRTGVLVSDPAGIKRIFQTRQKAYIKDLEFAYKPFLSILGTGLVTADGAHWQKQRLLMAPALRVDMLDAIIPITHRAADRLCQKLAPFKGTGTPVDIEEELRLLTLQIIGEAILSLGAVECDRVFPALYLPVMEESNRRVLQPWRLLYPLEVMRYNSRVRQLNSYIAGIIRARRAARAAGAGRPTDGKGDILDRILASVEDRGERWGPAVEEQLCYEIKTFLLAGHETSAAMLT
jgi:hypothetical protein